MIIPFGPDFMKRYHEALERQKRRDEERRSKGHVSFFDMTREQQLEYIKNNPRLMKFLEEQGFTLDQDGNLIEMNKES